MITFLALSKEWGTTTLLNDKTSDLSIFTSVEIIYSSNK